MQIYVAIKLNENQKAYLKSHVIRARLIFKDEIEKEHRCDVFLQSDICFGNVRPDWLEMTDRLQWIQLQSVGFGEYQKVKGRVPFIMTHLKNFFAVPVAETALAGILTLYRGIYIMEEDRKSKNWRGVSLRPHLHLLHKKDVLILGGGAIGQHFKKLLAAFDCDTTVYGRRATNSDIQADHELDEAIGKCDILVSILPGTKETIGIINRDRLESLKSSALFVNVGRGSAVDEPVLIELLKNKKIAGAVLDVTYEEPLPVDHPLWDCPNTLITQHTAGGYDDEILDIVKVFLGNLERFQSGESLEHEVDLKRGY